MYGKIVQQYPSQMHHADEKRWEQRDMVKLDCRWKTVTKLRRCTKVLKHPGDVETEHYHEFIRNMQSNKSNISVKMRLSPTFARLLGEDVLCRSGLC